MENLQVNHQSQSILNGSITLSFLCTPRSPIKVTPPHPVLQSHLRSTLSPLPLISTDEALLAILLLFPSPHLSSSLSWVAMMCLAP